MCIIWECKGRRLAKNIFFLPLLVLMLDTQSPFHLMLQPEVFSFKLPFVGFKMLQFCLEQGVNMFQFSNKCNVCSVMKCRICIYPSWFMILKIFFQVILPYDRMIGCVFGKILWF